MNVVLEWAEYEEAAYVGFRRAALATKLALSDDEAQARPHFGAHIDGAIAEKVVSKALGLYWPAHLRPNRSLGDLELRGGMKVEVRHTHRANGGLPIHAGDPDDHLAVLVRGRFPTFEVAGGRYVVEGKSPSYWRADLERPCFLVPSSDLYPITDFFVA
jgi:hypothetical protein